MLKKKLIIFDLDGTLALIDHRRHLVEGKNKNWDAFFEACDEDKPNYPIIDVFFGLEHTNNFRIRIWSGRSESVRKKTEFWLGEHGLGGVKLKMRPIGDYQSDVFLKKSWLDELDEKPHLVFDDRNSVVQMWRSNGIPCAQVEYGDF